MLRKSGDRVSRGACDAFLAGVAAFWIALESRLSRDHVDLLTVHMVQHLLTMTVGVGLDDDRPEPELPQKPLFPLNRILLEKTSNHDGIEIRSNFNYRAIHKATYPTVAVVEPHAILGGS